MNTQHTPGPWKVKRDNDGLVSFRISGDKLILADCWMRRTYESAPLPEIAEANAKLIAAAPELLEALKALQWLVGAYDIYSTDRFAPVSKWNIDDQTRRTQAISNAKAVITKATKQD